MRITVNGLRAETTIKKTINPNFWNVTRGRALERTAYAKELNMYLDSVRARITHIHREMELDNIEFLSAQMVLDRYLGRDKAKRHSLMEVFQEHNDKCRSLAGIDMSPATVVRYETSKKHTLEFMQHKYKKNDIYLDEMSRQFIEDYEVYLKTIRKCNHNSTTKYLKNFKKIIRIALQKEWLKKDPFSDIRFHLDPVEPDFLEKHEIEMIYRKEFNIQRLELVKDIFIFCAFTGLAFSDVKQLTSDHIFIDINGNKWIRKSRQKTMNMCNIPLLDIPIKIIEKYENHVQCQTKGILLPVLSNQKMNGYLKEVADLCGIKKQITMHTARHTFATFMLANKVSIENVAKMLGHSDTKMTRHYAKVLDQTILNEVSMVKTFI